MVLPTWSAARASTISLFGIYGGFRARSPAAGLTTGWITSAYSAPVTVNLGIWHRDPAAGGVTGIENVRGGQGIDTLTGDSQGNVLIGGAGTNTIEGGTAAAF